MAGRGRRARARARRAAVALLLALAIGAVTAVPAAASTTYRCTEQAGWPTPGDDGVVVLDGDLVGDAPRCELHDVHVLGDVRSASGTVTDLFSSVVEGDVTTGGVVNLISTTVRGDVRGTGSAYVGAHIGHVEGDVSVSGSVVLLGGTTVAGDVIAAATPEEWQLWVLRTRIGGNLVGHGGGMWIQQVEVAGRMALTRWDVLELCAGTVGKDVVLASPAGPGELGHSACEDGQGPAIGGSLIAVHVRREVTVQVTSVGRDLRCIASPGVVQLSGVSVGGYRDPACRSR